MPPHRVYIETHLGGGSVLRHKRAAEHSIGIERDSAVVGWWRANPVPGVDVYEGDATEFLRSFPFTGEELVYSDPPYVPSSRRRNRCYRSDYDDHAHVQLIRVLRGLPCPVMLSGYPSDLYSSLLGDWRTATIAVASHVGLREEIIWFNFDPPNYLHDHGHLGSNFRERERIRRRVRRWVNRLDEMPISERNAVISALLEKYPQLPTTLHLLSHDVLS
jgi:DNA adenine methylase